MGGKQKLLRISKRGNSYSTRDLDSGVGDTPRVFALVLSCLVYFSPGRKSEMSSGPSVIQFSKLEATNQRWL
jgi:hypothetical protein